LVRQLADGAWNLEFVRDLELGIWNFTEMKYLCAQLAGLVAEWLGNGLQNRVQRFESARDLEMKSQTLV
jgi:hypothetical protein